MEQNHASSTDNSISVWHLKPQILFNSPPLFTHILEIIGKKLTFGIRMAAADQAIRFDNFQQLWFPMIF